MKGPAVSDYRPAAHDRLRSLVARRYTWAAAAGAMEAFCARVAGHAADADTQRVVRHA